VERAERSGGLHKRSAEAWGNPLRARGAELPLGAFAVASHVVRAGVAGTYRLAGGALTRKAKTVVKQAEAAMAELCLVPNRSTSPQAAHPTQAKLFFLHPDELHRRILAQTTPADRLRPKLPAPPFSRPISGRTMS
jgi:hypothetical protein